MKYILSGENIDLELTFDTEEEAKAKMREWIENDKKEFGQDTENEYYIREDIHYRAIEKKAWKRGSGYSYKTTLDTWEKENAPESVDDWLDGLECVDSLFNDCDGAEITLSEDGQPIDSVFIDHEQMLANADIMSAR